MCPRHDLSFGACTTACLASDLLVSKGPRPHLWFFHAKQLVLTLRVPALMFCFCMQNRDFWGRITSIYGSQTSPVVLCIQNRVISITITSLYVSFPLLWILDAKQRLLDPKNRSPWVPDLTSCYVIPKQHDLHQNYLTLRVPFLMFCF